MAKLSEYLETRQLSQREFAQLVDVDPSIVSRLCKSAMMPSLPLAARIEAVTRGAVTAISWAAHPSENSVSFNAADTAPMAGAGQPIQKAVNKRGARA